MYFDFAYVVLKTRCEGLAFVWYVFRVEHCKGGNFCFTVAMSNLLLF